MRYFFTALTVVSVGAFTTPRSLAQEKVVQAINGGILDREEAQVRK